MDYSGTTYLVKNKNKSLNWTYYKCENIHFMESSNNDYLKIYSYFHFLRILVNTKKKGFLVHKVK